MISVLLIALTGRTLLRGIVSGSIDLWAGCFGFAALGWLPLVSLLLLTSRRIQYVVPTAIALVTIPLGYVGHTLSDLVAGRLDKFLINVAATGILWLLMTPVFVVVFRCWQMHRKLGRDAVSSWSGKATLAVSLVWAMFFLGGPFLNEMYVSSFSGAYDSGVIALEDGNYRGAVQAFDLAIQLDPRVSDAYYYRGYCHLRLGQTDQAEGDFREAIRLNSDDWEAHRMLGDILAERSDFEGARKAYDKSILINSDDNWVAFFRRGILLYEFEKYKEAIADFEHVTKLQPSNDAAFHNLSLCFKALGDREQSRVNFLKARKLNPWRYRRQTTRRNTTPYRSDTISKD